MLTRNGRKKNSKNSIGQVGPAKDSADRVNWLSRKSKDDTNPCESIENHQDAAVTASTYFSLSRWYIFKCNDEIDKADHTPNGNKLERLPLPESGRFDKEPYCSCILAGWLESRERTSKLSSQNSVHEPKFVMLENLAYISFNPHSTYRGYWVAAKETTSDDLTSSTFTTYRLLEPCCHEPKPTCNSQLGLFWKHRTAIAVLSYFMEYVFCTSQDIRKRSEFTLPRAIGCAHVLKRFNDDKHNQIGEISSTERKVQERQSEKVVVDFMNLVAFCSDILSVHLSDAVPWLEESCIFMTSLKTLNTGKVWSSTADGITEIPAALSKLENELQQYFWGESNLKSSKKSKHVPHIFSKIQDVTRETGLRAQESEGDRLQFEVEDNELSFKPRDNPPPIVSCPSRVATPGDFANKSDFRARESEGDPSEAETEEKELSFDPRATPPTSVIAVVGDIKSSRFGLGFFICANKQQ